MTSYFQTKHVTRGFKLKRCFYLELATFFDNLPRHAEHGFLQHWIFPQKAVSFIDLFDILRVGHSPYLYRGRRRSRLAHKHTHARSHTNQHLHYCQGSRFSFRPLDGQSLDEVLGY